MIAGFPLISYTRIVQASQGSRIAAFDPDNIPATFLQSLAVFLSFSLRDNSRKRLPCSVMKEGRAFTMNNNLFAVPN
jgi:hypothetical protein